MISAMTTTFDWYTRMIFESLTDADFVARVAEARNSQAVRELLFDRVTRVHDEAEAVLQATDLVMRSMGRT